MVIIPEAYMRYRGRLLYHPAMVYGTGIEWRLVEQVSVIEEMDVLFDIDDCMEVVTH